MRLHIDFETRSQADLRRTGVYAYAEHPSTDLWCAAYAVGDEEPQVWLPGDPVPSVILENADELEVHAWNAQFERVIWWTILVPRYGWPRPSREQFYCTAADAAALALPRALDQAGQALGLETTKDLDGHRLMLQMAKPRKPRKGEDPTGTYWWTEPQRLSRLVAYCRQDVVVEREISKRIRPLGEYERRVYLLDQAMNDRGVLIDAELVDAAQVIVDEGLRRANAELQDLTGGAVSAVSKVGELTRWFRSAGVEVANVRKDTIRDLLGDYDGLDETTRRVAELRNESAKSSTAKLASMRDARCSDNRARGLLLYHGASTGRWSGKLIQPQNLPRGDYWRGAEQTSVKAVDQYIPAVLAGDYDSVDADHPALVVVAAMLRSMIVAAPGHRLMAADYAQIEARVLAWIAGQDDLVGMFAQGGRIYEEMASVIYGIPVEDVTKDGVERQVGKNTVLGCGFQMGARRFQEQAKAQTGLDLPEDLCERAVGSYRERFPEIPSFWKEIQAAAKEAIRSPGSVVGCGRGGAIRFTVRAQFLWCVLPSGRPLAYAKPRVDTQEWVNPRTGQVEGVQHYASFLGVNSYSRKWERTHAYGGLWTENVVQAMARDLIVAAMLRLEAHGYRPVLTVHDEVVSETPEGHGTLEEYLKLMRVRPQWATGIPVSVEGWEGARYRK
jgi:DNA polymerase bacteriophage-type